MTSKQNLKVKNETKYSQLSTFSTLSNKLVDIEGNEYNIGYVGSQVWMAENLKTTLYNDASSIPLVKKGVNQYLLVIVGTIMIKYNIKILMGHFITFTLLKQGNSAQLVGMCQQIMNGKHLRCI